MRQNPQAITTARECHTPYKRGIIRTVTMAYKETKGGPITWVTEESTLSDSTRAGLVGDDNSVSW